MIWIILKYLIVVIAGLSSAHFEVERLIKSGRWQESVASIKFWNTDQTSLIKKLFDSYHFMFGLMITSLISLLFFDWLWYEPVIVLLEFWYVRNIGMLVLFLKKKRWAYLSPILPNLIEKIIREK